MTVLILAQRKIFSCGQIQGLALRAGEYFLWINKRGALTLLFAALALIGLATYLAALVMSFNSGMAMGEVSAQNIKSAEELRRMEVLERQREAQFTILHREFLAGMDKISKVKYLLPEGEAVSQASSVIR
jgi:hypothetical protein